MFNWKGAALKSHSSTKDELGKRNERNKTIDVLWKVMFAKLFQYLSRISYLHKVHKEPQSVYI